MSWGGTMKCLLVNQTGNQILAVYVNHNWESHNDAPDPNPTVEMAANGGIGFLINVGAGGSDDWSVAFTDMNGKYWYRSGKQCDVESEDYNSGQEVQVVLGSGGFSIQLPKSSSCNNNYYNTITP